MQKLSSNEIKRIRSLSQKKFRDELGLFIVEGEKMVAEAAASGFAVENVYRRDEIGEETMSRISRLASPSPVLAVVRKPGCPTAADAESIRKIIRKGRSADGSSAAGGLYLFLDTIRDPGNLGTIVRVADWFGIDGIFATEDTVDLYNPKVVQSTMGAIFRVDFHYADLREAAACILQAGGKVYGTFMDGRDIYTAGIETGEHSPVAIVTGNEADGISPEMEALVSERLSIPPYPAGDPGSESLNAAVATAVTVAEFRRRTGQHIQQTQ